MCKKSSQGSVSVTPGPLAFAREVFRHTRLWTAVSPAVIVLSASLLLPAQVHAQTTVEQQEAWEWAQQRGFPTSGVTSNGRN